MKYWDDSMRNLNTTVLWPCELMTLYLHWLHDIDSDLVNWWPLACIGFVTLTATLWTDDPLPTLASWDWQRPCELTTPCLHCLHDIDSDLVNWWPFTCIGFMTLTETLWTDDPLACIGFMTLTATLLTDDPLTCIGLMTLTATLWTDDPLPALASWHWQRTCELMTLYLHWLHDIDSDLVNWWPLTCIGFMILTATLWTDDPLTCIGFMTLTATLWTDDPLTCIGFMTLTLWTDDPLPALASWHWQWPCELMTPLPALASWHWQRPCELMTPYLHWLHDIDSDIVNWWPFTCIGFMTFTATLWTDDPLPALASWHWQRPDSLHGLSEGIQGCCGQTPRRQRSVGVSLHRPTQFNTLHGSFTKAGYEQHLQTSQPGAFKSIYMIRPTFTHTRNALSYDGKR